jgi:DNA-binding NarL/FixJ family response regulator
MEIETKQRSQTDNQGDSVKTFSILILDDHMLIRDGLRTILESLPEPKFKVHEAGNIDEAIQLMGNEQIEIALVDYRIHDRTGDEFVGFLSQLYPNVKAIGLSNYDESTYVAKMVSKGARGYILKNVSIDELVSCIQKVSEGQFYYSKDVLSNYIGATDKEKLKADNELKEIPQEERLTPKELEILKLIALEFTNEEIADFLGCSKRTVDNHRHKMLEKTKSRNTVGLIRYAIDNKLIDT